MQRGVEHRRQPLGNRQRARVPGDVQGEELLRRLHTVRQTVAGMLAAHQDLSGIEAHAMREAVSKTVVERAPWVAAATRGYPAEWHTGSMLVRLILYVLGTWLVLTVIRAALNSVVPHNPQYRRPATRGVIDLRRKALATLGLYDGASKTEIKKAYKEMASKYHPDRVAHLGPELEELTAEKFKEVSAAYELLNGRS